MGLSKLIKKVNKAKSAVNSLKGISSKIKSLNYDSVTDQLGEEAEAAQSLLQKARKRDTSAYSQSNLHKNLAKKKPETGATELMYPHGDLLENYIVFNIKPRKQGTLRGPGSLSRTEGTNRNLLNNEEVDIVLYIPDGITSESSVTYTGQDFGLGAKQLDQIITRVKGSSKGNAWKTAVDAGLDGAAALLGTQITSLLNGMTGGIENLKAGRAANPMQEAIFEGITFRQFSFDYQFYPKNEAEAETVNHIIYTFRTAMLPDTFGASYGSEELDSLMQGTENFFNYPNVFKVSFDGPIAEKVDGFLPMVCTDCSVDHFNGNKVATFANGQPVSTSMSLKFQEIKLLTQESYNHISPYGQRDKIDSGAESERDEANV